MKIFAREWFEAYVRARQSDAARHHKTAATLVSEAPDEARAWQRHSANEAALARIALLGVVHSDPDPK